MPRFGRSECGPPCEPVLWAWARRAHRHTVPCHHCHGCCPACPHCPVCGFLPLSPLAASGWLTCPHLSVRQNNMPAHCPPVPHLHPQSPATGQDSPAQGLSVSPRVCVPGRFSPARCEQWLGLLAVSVTCCIFVTQPLMVSSSLSRSHHGAQEGAGGSVWGPVAAVLGLTRETGGRAKLRGTSVSRSPGHPVVPS